MAFDLMQYAIDAAIEVVQNAQEELRERIAQEIRMEHSSAKKSGWADNIASAMVADTPHYDPRTKSVTGSIFLPEDHEDSNYVRAMVLATGNQAEGPLRTKPGQRTWDGDIAEKSIHVPEGNVSTPLPDAFNFPSGQNFVENAVKRYADKFAIDVLAAQNKIKEEAMRSL